ncbi:MAG: hypothetical protein OXI18_04645 [bacterium]|nr:hypothetical protein [bacterium]
MNKRATHLSDTLLDELRQANPVRIDALPSSRDPKPARTLEKIVVHATLEPLEEAVAFVDRARRRRRQISSLAAAVVVVVAVGVGVFAIDFGTAPDATAAVHDAAATSVGDSMSWETRVTIGLAEPDEPLEFSITGTVSGGDSQIRLQSQSDMSAVGLPEIGPFSVVAVDGDVYISPAVGIWEGPQPVSEFPLLSAIAADTMIGGLQQVTGFTRIGDEEVAGERWTRYQADAAPNDAVRAILTLTLGLAQMPVDSGPTGDFESPLLNVWIDGDNLIRRVSFGPETVGAGGFSAVTTFDGFGDPVEIARPAA